MAVKMNDIEKEQTEREEQLYQLTTLAAGDLSLQEVLDKLAKAAVKITGVKACSIRLLDEQAGDLKMRSTYGLSESYRNKGVVSMDDPVIKAAFSGRAVVLDDMRADDRVKYKEATIAEGLVSQLTVAMEFRRRPIGVIRLYSPQPKRFDEDDISLARAVASQCAVAITNAKLIASALEASRMAEQMRLAGVIQRRMIPDRAPEIPGLDIAATYIPCFEVGGDLYTFFKVAENRIAIDIADVIGKGIPAAIVMSWFRGALRAAADTLMSVQPADILKMEETARLRLIINKINSMACDECRDGEFITLFHATFDVASNKLIYCNCGHEPTVLIRDGQASDLDKGGLVLGVDRDTHYEIGSLQLQDGDCFLLYTDGLIDAANFDGDFWGRDRMLDAAKQFISCPADQIIKNILAYRRRFVGLASQVDDTSMVVIKVRQTGNN
jgi:sigma-B regulation protein RsbU (phosphoserine phosphatase)